MFKRYREIFKKQLSLMSILFSILMNSIYLIKESNNDHISRSRPSLRFCNISVHRNFAIFTGKHLHLRLVFTCYLSYISTKKTLSFYSRFKTYYTPLDRFYYFRKPVVVADTSKRICNFSVFICYVRETREHYQ